MTLPKKFSELEEVTIPLDLEQFQNGIYVPIVMSLSGQSRNLKMNMKDFVLRILSKFAGIEDSGGSSGGSSGGGDSGEGTTPSGTSDVTTADIQNLQLQINAINNTISTLSSANNYPTHVIRLIDPDNNEVSYNLPSGPNAQSLRITIRTAQLERPKFKLTVATVGISKNDSLLFVSVYAEADATASNYDGGSVNDIKVSGNYTSNNTSGTFNETTVMLARTVNPGNKVSNSVQLTANLSEPINLAVIQLNIKYGNSNLGITVTSSIVGNSDSNGSASTYIF